MGNLIAFVLTSVLFLCQFLLLFDARESRSEPLCIDTVSSSVICEFNHPVAESFSKTGLKQHTILLMVLLLGKEEVVFWVLGRWKEGN